MALRISINKVPKDIRRVAAEHLEAVRDEVNETGAKQAYLGDEVCPIYRPDMTDVAYYEFEVVGTGRQRRIITTSDMRLPSFSTGTGIVGLQRAARGFIIASTGKHDFPIAHFSLEHPPISVQLEADADKNNKKVAKIYKLDALSYVAEDSRGNQISQIGNLPIIPKSFPGNIDRYRDSISKTILSAGAASDERVSRRRRALKKTGPPPQHFELIPDVTWHSLKSEYKRRFEVQLADLEQNAKKAWEIQSLVKKHGEGVLVGEPQNIALLRRAASVEIVGDGADIVKMKLIDRGDGPPSLELRIDDFPFDRETNFKIHIRYDDGTKEELDFFAVSQRIPSRVRKPINEEQ